MIRKFEVQVSEEESEMLEMYVNAPKMHSILWDIKQFLRDKVKYGEGDVSQFASVKEKLNELMFEEGIVI